MIEELDGAGHLDCEESVFYCLTVKDDQGNKNTLCFDLFGKLVKDVSSDVDEDWAYDKVREFYYSKLGGNDD